MPAAKPVAQPTPSPARPPSPPSAEGATKKGAGKGGEKPTKLRTAFGSRKQPPTREDFSAKLDPAAAKRFDGTRAWLTKQKGVAEDVFYYGASAGWGLRYLCEGAPVCALFITGDFALAVASLDGQTDEAIAWEELAEATQESRGVAQGNAAHMWVDVPLDAKGHADLRVLVKARLATLADR